jgi:hypothetical protein
MDDFTPLNMLGKGAFGTVILVEKKDDEGRLYALKSINK